MIVLDTHIWIWWVHGDPALDQAQMSAIKANETDAIGVCANSCWGIAKLVEYGRLELPCSLKQWFEQALAYPGILLWSFRQTSRSNPPPCLANSIVIPPTKSSLPQQEYIIARA